MSCSNSIRANANKRSSYTSCTRSDITDVTRVDTPFCGVLLTYHYVHVSCSSISFSVACPDYSSLYTLTGHESSPILKSDEHSQAPKPLFVLERSSPTKALEAKVDRARIYYIVVYNYYILLSYTITILSHPSNGWRKQCFLCERIVIV